MDENRETEITSIVSDINDISIPDSVTESDSEPSGSVQVNSNENVFALLKEKSKHIFVLSTAGKPIYTR